MFKKLVYLTCLVLVLATVAEAQDPSLVAWWKFDDGSGTTAVDSSSNGNDATLFGDPVWVDGYIDGALSFDGTDDYADLPIGSQLRTMNNCTITTWVNWSGTGTWSRIFDFGSSTAMNMFLTPSNGYTNTPRFAITITGWQDEDQLNTEEFLLTEWQHIAVVIDMDNTTHKLYLDGELLDENTEARYGPNDLGDPEPNQVWLGRSQYEGDAYFSGSLDDFRVYNRAFSHIEMHSIIAEDARLAWEPTPVDDQVDVTLDQKLIWKSGIIQGDQLYNEHQVYIGTDFNDVYMATEPTTTVTGTNEYTAPLDYDTTYYWRVDEVDSSDPENPVKGDVWSFKTCNFIVVEDFEDYNDYPPNEIFMTWVDGYGDITNGSVSGYPAPDFVGGEHYMEGENVHGGSWSMPIIYNNGTAGLSEVTKTINADWTIDDVLTLTLFFYGSGGNMVETMYVALDGNAMVTNNNPRAVLVSEWTRWDVLLQDFADQGVDLTNVNSISIGFGNKTNPTPGGSGQVLFDDIRLYRSLPEEVEAGPEPVDPGTANLEVYYDFENDVQDNSGNGRHATAQNDPTYTTGPTGFGSAIELNGSFHYIDLPIGSVINSLNNCTITAWVNWSGRGDAWQRIFDFGDPPATDDENPNNYMFLTSDAGGAFRFAITTSDTEDEEMTTATPSLPSGWHHVAVTIDPGNTTHTLYLDGKVVAQNTEAVISPSDLGVTTQNWIGRSQWAADAYFDGAIDEFRIYDRLLSEAELLFLMGW